MLLYNLYSWVCHTRVCKEESKTEPRHILLIPEKYEKT